MISKYTLFKKLSSYSALASVAALATSKSDGQIIYHDIIPDTTIVKAIHSGIYSLDLDSNGTIDFNLSVNSSFNKESNMADINAMNSNALERDTVQFLSHFADPNNYNNLIGAINDWVANDVKLDSCKLPFVANQGVFAGKGDKFIGLKLIRGGKTYYGWVRVKLSSHCDTLIIKDYAYNDTEGASISAGEEATGIKTTDKNEGTLEPSYPNPATTISYITYIIPIQSSVTITLFDVTGRKIETLLNITSQSPGRHVIPVNVTNLSSGVYFYTLTVNGQTFKEKIVVAH